MPRKPIESSPAPPAAPRLIKVDRATSLPSPDPGNGTLPAHPATSRANVEPLTAEQFGPMKRSILEHLKVGQIPPPELLTALAEKHQVPRKALKMNVGQIARVPHLTRPLGFQVERRYFTWIETWEGKYKDLLARIADELGMALVCVEAWIGFLCRKPWGMMKGSEIDDAQRERLEAWYREYLAGEAPPELGIGPLLAAEIGSTKEQAHVGVWRYRTRIREAFFERKRAAKAQQAVENATPPEQRAQPDRIPPAE